MNIRLLTKADREAYNGFLLENNGPIEQSHEWGELQCTVNGRPDFFVLGVFEDNKIIAGQLIIRQNIKFGKSWLWCPGGPVFALCLNQESRQRIFEKLKTAIKENILNSGDLYLRIEPAYEAGIKLFENEKKSKNSYLPRDTLILDLDKNEEELLKEMKQKGRYNIKIAKNAGLEIRKNYITDGSQCRLVLDSFYNILKETGSRDGFHLHAKSFYENFMKIVGENAILYSAHLDNKVLGGILITYFGGRATYYFGASSNEYRNLMAPYLLQWTAILDAKRSGMKSYDFLGIAPDNSPNHALRGVSEFKLKFGGKRLQYEKAVLIVYKPFLSWLVFSFKSVARSIKRMPSM